MGQPRPRHARHEAQAVLGDDSLVAYVLEPSPPSVTIEPYADDPAVPELAERAVTPTSAGALTWDALAARRDEVADFAATRWLGAWRRLPPLPDGLGGARHDLHLLAFYVMAPARRRVNGRIGLRWTLGGFGTPFFGEDDTQLRVEAGALVVQSRDGVQHASLSTLRHAGELAGAEPTSADKGEFDAPDLPDLDAPLHIGVTHVEFTDAWFGFGASVLEQLRVDGATLAPSRVQLWPEHFDLAVELGSVDAGRRATFGASPGDAQHPAPYLYVAAWQRVDRSIDFWNDMAFNGASLSWDELTSSADQRRAALDFFHAGLAALG